MTKVKIVRLAAQYPKLVEWSEADGCFVGRCPALFGGGVHGSDEAKVYRELCQVAREWVKILHADGVPLPKSKRSGTYSGRFVVRVNPVLHQKLAVKAQAEGESLNTLVGKALFRA